MNKTVKEIYDVNLDDIIQPHENEIVKKDKLIRLLALLVKKLQIFVKKILIEKYNFN
ncbi:hypothetical protein [Spiroplasma poulsonii]|uniref:Uncharacterized protein n=1 Tax=Spiroplasma poulsonii TaxID=2138 RepID=A0A2P6FG44_9MOLU|nr:hypothetical protein [Spiroplasma poulsonii]KAF0849943.1 Energy-coupling factor transporter ATP-binding protein EcfA3 [Spiroplasma poulsonii]PQM32437.1 hypothetical protein SMSRO_SF023580 [Spiroplasma poulsonii]PWF95103.1 hypothetical protein SMSE_05280 [Spiroplasma poulsonii]PWF97896.1 hypothetical protein SMH99_04460 [Spiroplasma poulsonii]